MARGAAALMLDLKQRGMLEDTLILWTTEFGRMPRAQGSKGRDHNPFVFTNWLAGGGIRGGVTHGESDQWGFRPADRNNPTSCHDIHATILHQLGIDHEQLTVRHDGIDRRLTDARSCHTSDFKLNKQHENSTLPLRIHPDRVIGGDRDYCNPCRPAPSSIGEGKTICCEDPLR